MYEMGFKVLPAHIRKLALLFAGIALILGVTGCSNSASKPWGLMNITGHVPDLRFTLKSDDGQTIDQDDFRGKLVLLYFGYTHCTDVCPTTLADLATAIKQLGSEADQVKVLFVSVDPKRDTPAVLKSYVSEFGPWFVGASGSQSQLIAITKRYRVAYRLGKPDAQGNYTVYHSSAVFIFDRLGKARLLTTSSGKTEIITTDLKRLLEG